MLRQTRPVLLFRPHVAAESGAATELIVPATERAAGPRRARDCAHALAVVFRTARGGMKTDRKFRLACRGSWLLQHGGVFARADDHLVRESCFES